jgi:3-hydroxyacyl-[acyl-carrier-protein] dehydratase
VVALKNVTINEPFFQGHFPYYPVMPGVLIVEAMAQAAAILTFHTEKAKADERSVYFFVGIDNARFKKPVVPGDSLRLEVSLNRQVRGIWKFGARAMVDDALVAESQLMCTVRKISEDA